MNINRDTKLYGSFSKQAGNKGCEFFNPAFEKYKINAIYKSFSIENIEDAVKAARTLGFSGFAVSMPHKLTVYEYIDENKSKVGRVINTVVKENGKLVGYNTDYIGVFQILETMVSHGDFFKIWIIGTGGLASAVTKASDNLGLETFYITRGNSDRLKSLEGQLIYNCSPADYSWLENTSNNYIDGRIGTEYGDMLHAIQAKAQFKLYTGIDYE